jgi:hypothetical protein
MVERGVRLSPVTALHKLQHLFFAFFRTGRGGVLEGIVKAEGVTAAD